MGKFARRPDYMTITVVLPARHDLLEAITRPGILSVQRAIEIIVVRTGDQLPQRALAVLSKAEAFHIPDLLRGSRAGSDTKPSHTPHPFHTRTFLF